MLTKDRISALFFLALSIAYGAFAFDIRLMPFGAADVFTPRTMPYALSVLGILISLGILVAPSSAATAKPTSWASYDWRRLSLLGVNMVIYAFLITRIGFIPSTSLFLIVGFAILGERRPAVLLGASVPVAIVFWLILDPLLGIFLGDVFGRWGALLTAPAG